MLVLGVAALLVMNQSEKSRYVSFPEERFELVDKGLDQETQDFLKERIAGYEEVLADDELPSSDRVGYLVAMASDYESLGEYAMAKQLLEDALSIAPKNQPIRKTYSELFYRMQDYENALLESMRAIELDTVEPLPWLWRLELEEKLLVDPIDADVLYQEAREVVMNDYNLMVAHAEFRARNGDNSGAIEVWEELQEAFPEQFSFFQEKINQLQGE